MLREITNCKTEQGNIKDDPRACFSAREEESVQKDPQWWEYIKGTQKPTEKNFHSWHNLSHKINIHVFTLIWVND